MNPNHENLGLGIRPARVPKRSRRIIPELRDVVVAASGELPQELYPELSALFFSNILYMRGVVSSPIQELRDALPKAEDSISSCSGSLTSRRRNSAKIKALKYILDVEADLHSSLCGINIDTFAVFFGPSQSVPKSSYLLHFPSMAASSSSASSNSSSGLAHRLLMRAMVMHWSQTKLLKDSRSNIFVGFRVTKESSLSFSPKMFSCKPSFDSVLKKKSRLQRSHFAIRASKSFVPMSEDSDFFGTNSDWYILKRPIKPCR